MICWTKCNRRDRVSLVPLRALEHQADSTPVWKLEAALFCEPGQRRAHYSRRHWAYMPGLVGWIQSPSVLPPGTKILRIIDVQPHSIRPSRLGATMTGEQSRSIVVGDRVRWRDDDADLGSVTEKDWAGVTIKWDNRSEQSILHNDMTEVFLVPKRM